MFRFLCLLWNNRGELDLGGKDSFTAAEVQDLVNKQVDTLVQPKIDSIITSRLAQQARQFEGFEDLKKFKEDHTKQTEADQQKRLEEQGKYDEAMKTHNVKLGELSGVIETKDSIINGMQIGNALTSEIVVQGGYLEESLAMLRASAQLKDGVVVIKGKDANNLDKDLTVAEGVKAFLASKPHLVKANANAGGGGSGGGSAGNEANAGAGEQGGDLTALNNLLTKQIYANDTKGAQETTAKIKALAVEKGITISGGIIA